MNKSIVIFFLADLLTVDAGAQAINQTVNNGVISMSITPGVHGGAISSLKFGNVETVDSFDQGRLIQTSIFFDAGQETGVYVPCANATLPQWLNPQEGGDICGNPSPTWGGDAGAIESGEVNVATTPLDWSAAGVRPAGFQIFGNHKIGPLPYMNSKYVARLLYTYKSTTQSINPLHYLHWNTPNLVPYAPAMVFRASVLNRLYGLSMDGMEWVDVTDSVSTHGDNASSYRFKAMAWATPDTINDTSGWGVAVYGGWTLSQTCAGPVVMELTSQNGQCPNYSASSRILNTASDGHGISALNLLDQTLPVIPVAGSATLMPHIVVGNLDTIRSIVNGLYSQGY